MLHQRAIKAHVRLTRKLPPTHPHYLPMLLQAWTLQMLLVMVATPHRLLLPCGGHTAPGKHPRPLRLPWTCLHAAVPRVTARVHEYPHGASLPQPLAHLDLFARHSLGHLSALAVYLSHAHQYHEQLQ